MGERRPRVLDVVLSDLSVSFDFFPFLLPKSPPKIPFFFFLVSPFSPADGRPAFDFWDAGVCGGSSTSWPASLAASEVCCGAAS